MLMLLAYQFPADLHRELTRITQTVCLWIERKKHTQKNEGFLVIQMKQRFNGQFCFDTEFDTHTHTHKLQIYVCLVFESHQAKNVCCRYKKHRLTTSTPIS